MATPPPEQTVYLEAEAFANRGGWVIDQQAMDTMGSPYLLAHGLGVPVADATMTFDLPAKGRYHVWVRTRDWVAPWKAPGAPGRFQVLLGGKPLDTTFGTEGACWHWQDGGVVTLSTAKITVGLHDLTGFDGRCEAICLTTDVSFRPPDDGSELSRFSTPVAVSVGGTWRRGRIRLRGCRRRHGRLLCGRQCRAVGMSRCIDPRPPGVGWQQ